MTNFDCLYIDILKGLWFDDIDAYGLDSLKRIIYFYNSHKHEHNLLSKLKENVVTE